MENITSRSNPFITECIKLRDRGYRTERGLFVFEGKKLFDEAVSRGVVLSAVLATGKYISYCENALHEGQCERLIEVPEMIYNKLSEEKSPDGIFCVAKTIDKYHEFATIYINTRKSGSKLLIESMRDPGNLGTVIRSAAAFGADEIILSSDCADIYNSKTVRASMGALFDTPIKIVSDLSGAVRTLRNEGYEVYAATLSDNSKKLNELNISSKTCFVVGNEGHGLSDALIDACTGNVIIPMSGRTESLNAAAAAAVLLWEVFRTVKPE